MVIFFLIAHCFVTCLPFFFSFMLFVRKRNENMNEPDDCGLERLLHALTTKRCIWTYCIPVYCAKLPGCSKRHYTIQYFFEHKIFLYRISIHSTPENNMPAPVHSTNLFYNFCAIFRGSLQKLLELTRRDCRREMVIFFF